MSAPAVLRVRSRARAAATTSPSRSLANKRTRLASLVRTELENSTTTHLPRNSIDDGRPGVAADDGPTSGRQLFHDEIAPVSRIPVIDEIRREDLMAGGAQRAHDHTATARRPPKAMWQVLDSEQRLNGNGRRFVEVVAALGERMALDLARMI